MYNKFLKDNDIYNLIKSRSSWRSFKKNTLDNKLKEKINVFIKSLPSPPFKSNIDFVLLES